MRTVSLLLGCALTAAAQDTRPDGLILNYRHVELQVVENLALLKVQFKVTNPTDRSLEGDLSFSMPAGAAVHGTDILKHISSTERKGRLVPPDQGTALYLADRARQLEDPLRETTATLRFLNGMRNDPVLLERAAEDRYRLRFVPVPARDNQTVTVWAAFEVTREAGTYSATVPMRWDSNFRTSAETRITGRVSFASADPFKTVACPSHRFGSVQRDEDGRRISAPLEGLSDGLDLQLSYGLGFWASPWDFATGGGGPSGTSTDLAVALRAIRSLRSGLASGVVSAQASLMVIPKQDARELAREGDRGMKPGSMATAPISEEEARECEFVRAAMKLPVRSWAPRCEIHVVSTTDPARLQWARDHGITSGRSNGLLQGTSFEYVKHGAGCRVQEPNVEKLRQQAGALK